MAYSHQEIFGQGQILLQTYDCLLKNRQSVLDFFAAQSFEEVLFVGCGSSYWLSLSLTGTWRDCLGKRCTAVKSGDMVMHPEDHRGVYKNPLVVAPSRSGTTEETLRALRFLKEEYGATVVAMVEYENAPLGAEADFTLVMPWANETSVCQTRSFSNLYMTGVLMAAMLGGRDALRDDIKRYLDDFARYSREAESALTAWFEGHPADRLITLGSGRQYGAAIEGAYIAIEMAQLPANYYGVLELRHGPVVMTDSRTMCAIYCRTASQTEERGMAADVRARGGRVLAIMDRGDFPEADLVFSLGREAADETVALYGGMVMQGFAYLTALRRGVDPDNPAGLVPFIVLS